MTAPTPNTVERFADFVRDLRAERWTQLPVDPRFAGFLARRLWPNGTVDTLIVYHLDSVYAHRELAGDQPGWSAEGTLHDVAHALSELQPPDQP